MLDAIKPLLDSGLINEDVGQELNKVWESKLIEARETVQKELREEFAQRYEHDRIVMVEALDKMITESLQTEIAEFHEEKKAINEDRVKLRIKMTENASKFNDFMVQNLANEIKELRKDRQLAMENNKKLEQFVVHALAKEIKEFYQDKQAVVEAKVKLVAEGRKQLEALKNKFVSESAARLSSAVTSHLKGEISQLREDIKSAKENNFGRKLFEAFASEYSVTYLDKNAETRKLLSVIKQKEQQLAEATKQVEETTKLVESKDREVRMIKESTQRNEVMSKLLGTLNKEKATVMSSLLESVQTTKLQAAFDKYLPAVLNTGSEKPAVKKAVITESVTEVTGNKTAKIIEEDMSDRDNVIDIRRLAGL